MGCFGTQPCLERQSMNSIRHTMMGGERRIKADQARREKGRAVSCCSSVNCSIAPSPVILDTPSCCSCFSASPLILMVAHAQGVSH